MRVGQGWFWLSAGLLLGACGGSPASLEFVDMTPEHPRIGESATVRFKATDSRGKPMGGTRVVFKPETEVAGVTLNPTSGMTNREDGMVSTQLTATARVASVTIVATAGDKTATSPSLSFAGSSPSAVQFTFQCGEIAGAGSGGVHAIGAYDETRYLIAGVKLNCNAHVGDRNGDGVPGAVVSFMTEAGTIGPSETTTTDVIGNAQVLYKTSYPLPLDVVPGVFSWTPNADATHTGEYIAPLWMHPFLWVENPVTQYAVPPTLKEPRRQDPLNPTNTNPLNPRDNLVTLIAMTAGEEGYEDRDNNGKYDEGEPLTLDLTEPFVDSNDNGTWDPGERYVDTDGNGSWDGKNGKFDANTLIWKVERILWTGIPHARDSVGAEPVMRLVSPASPPLIPHFGAVDVLFLYADPWFNTMAQNGPSDGCSTSVSDQNPLVIMSPSEVRKGFLFTYPSPSAIAFQIRDAHDPNAKALDGGSTTFSPPLPFSAPITCVTTASPISGDVVNLQIGTVVGTVE